MSRFFRSVSQWFGYSRRERRASFILLIIITLIIILRCLMPERKTRIESYSPAIIYKASPIKKKAALRPNTSVVFPFDPNTASTDALISLGINRRQVRTIIAYRDRGGRFRKPEDIYTIYGIDSVVAKHLIPYIVINEQKRNFHSFFLTDTSGGYKTKKRVFEKTDINNTDSAGLVRLPGIGPVFSSRIIKYRKLLGGFYSVEQLKEVYGITDSTFNLISGRIITDSSAIKLIDINKASFNELAGHPYLDWYDVQAIMKFRAIKGSIDSIDELIQNKILTPVKAGHIKPYLVFRK